MCCTCKVCCLCVVFLCRLTSGNLCHAAPAEKPSKPKTATKRSHAAMQSKASSSVSPLKKKAKKAKNDDDYEDEEGDKSLDDSEILSHS